MLSRDIPAEGITMTLANENIAAALSEQGYPLKQHIVSLLNSGTARQKLEWQIEASDMSFSLPNHFRSHVDFVLKRRSHLPPSMPDNQCHVVMKCKRATPDYDHWVFYSDINPANGLLSNRYHIEFAQASSSDPHQFKHALNPIAVVRECPVFERFVETRIETRFNKHKAASSTVAIEDALHQVTLGQTGLANTIHKTNIQMFRLIPVVVTTAELMSGHFDGEKVSLDDIENQPPDLKPEPRKWLAINYHISEVAAHFFTDNNKLNSVAKHLASRRLRTVFVVQAKHIQPFLEWLHKNNF